MEWIAQYWTEAIFGVVTAFFAWGYRKLSKKIKAEISDQNALKQGVQALLRDRIIQSHDHYTERGFIPIYAMENILAMYEPYRELGGNGTVTKLVDAAKKLPTSPPAQK